MTTCMTCEEPTKATTQLGDWDVCAAHAAVVTAVEPTEATELVCEGSGQAPNVRRGKPCCRVCGQKFHWSDLENMITTIPEHF